MTDQQVAIYARVSSDQQVETSTIQSQIAALREQVAADGLRLAADLIFCDDGYSGATLIRPALERLRDWIALHGLDRLYVHAPDRLARHYAYQVLLLEEFQRAGVKVIFLNQPLGQSPEDALLVQVQGMIAEYERAKIMERSRRGKRYAAQHGTISVLGGAPYGYRYITRAAGGGQARYEIIPAEAQAVQQIFHWVGLDRLSLREVGRRLKQQGVLTRHGKTNWNPGTLRRLLSNPAYKGVAAFGKTRQQPPRPKLRPQRGDPIHPRRPKTVVMVPEANWFAIPVPALVSEALFTTVQSQLAENRDRARQRQRGASYLVQGLAVCVYCQYAYSGYPLRKKAADGTVRHYAYYRCIGTIVSRFGGERICDNLQVRTDLLDDQVWQAVCDLLQNPQRLEQEFQRRLDGPAPENEALLSTQAQLTRLTQATERLIDSYTEGLIDKAEFEPRLQRLRQRRAALADHVRQLQLDLDRQAEFRLIITRLETFAAQVQSRLADADWSTKRDLIRTLVKRVEIGKDEVTVIFRVMPDPFEFGPQRESLQHRWGRVQTSNAQSQ